MNQTVFCYFSSIQEQTQKSITDVLQRHGNAPIRDSKATFENTSLIITTKGGQEFLCNVTLPIIKLFPLEDGLILKCKFKSSHSQSAEETLNVDFCYMTLTGHPLNDIHPLSVDQIPQIMSKASIVWVGNSLPLVVLCELDTVKICLVCRQNQNPDIFSNIKPDSRNRQINVLSDVANFELRTVHRVSLYQCLTKVTVTRGLAANSFCVSLLTNLNKVFVFESDLTMNFQLTATFENIGSITETNFINTTSNAELVDEDLISQLNDPSSSNSNTMELCYFKRCIQSLKEDVVMIDLLNNSLQVVTGGQYIIHSAKHSEATGIQATPSSIQLLKDGKLQICYESGRTLSLFFNLRLPCVFVGSITTALKRLLPVQDFLAYLSRLITLFKSEIGQMFEIFTKNFTYLIGIHPQQVQSLQVKTSTTTMFEKLMEMHLKSTSKQPLMKVHLCEQDLKKASEILKILQLLVEDLNQDRDEATKIKPLQNFVREFSDCLSTQHSSSIKFDLQYWCCRMDSLFPVLFERSRIVTRIYEVMNRKGSQTYFALQHQNHSALPQLYSNLSLVQTKVVRAHPCTNRDEYLMTGFNQRHMFENVLAVLTQESFTLEQISSLPYQVQLPIHEILTYTRSHIEEIKTFEWPSNFYILISREDILNNMQRYNNSQPSEVESRVSATFDLTKQLSFKNEARKAKFSLSSENFVQNLIGGQADQKNEGLGFKSGGLGATLKDSRFREVEFLLRSDVQMKIKEASQTGELSEEQFLANQKLMLDKMFKRQLSKCVGRGAVQLGTEETLPTEKLDIPQITASAFILKKSTQNDENPLSAVAVTITVEIKSKEEKEMMQWPDFHNGVAAALRIQRQSFGINPAKNSRNWIMYHRPLVPKNEHGGFLLGLGLLGQLSSLQPTDLYQHLKTAHDSTTIGILLGRAASKVGQMDDSDSRMMCLHIPALLPHTLSVEYSLAVQSAAVIGAGLLYMSTSCRAISEMLLSQIAKKPNTDKLIEREGYSFSAGLALGLVNLAAGKPNDSTQTQLLTELQLEERLVRFVQGGKALPLPRSMLSQIQLNENAKSSAVKETDQINTQITAPGALTALAFIYLKSNNSSIATRIDLPRTFTALDNVTPQILVLRVIARNLIMWDSIENTKGWITSQIPDFIRLVFESTNQASLTKELRYRIDEKEIDFASISQSFANIIAASVLSMGFKFAGTSDRTAKQTVLSEIAWFRKKVQTVVGVQPLGGPIQTNTSFATKNQLDKSTVEKCLCMCSLALGMIMAGSCDVESFKILRVLRKRFESEMNFGHNQAISQAMGMVFLGQGQYTFSRTNKAIAGLFCSVYPVFPQSPGDNRFHLQALRHFYLFGLETRLLQAKDIDTGNFVKIKVQVEVQHNGQLSTAEISTPEIVNGSIVSVTVKDHEFYHDISLSGSDYGMIVDQQNQLPNGDFQKSELQQIVYVKRKNFSNKVKMAAPVTETLQSMLKSQVSPQQLKQAAEMSLECLSHVSDPQIRAFLRTFATQFDATSALTNIMLQDKSNFFDVVAQVETKVNQYQQQNAQLSLVQLYGAYSNDRVDSLAILLSNLRSSLSSKGFTPDPVVEKISVLQSQNKNLAISVLDDLVKIGEQGIVRSYIKSFSTGQPLENFQLEIHNALEMCGLCNSEINEIVTTYQL